MFVYVIHFHYCCKAKDVYPQKFIRHFRLPSDSENCRKTMRKTVYHIEEDEKLTTAFMQTLYIQMKVTEATMQRCNFMPCIMHFATSYCSWVKSMKTLTVILNTMEQPMRQNKEGSKTQEKLICRIRCNGVWRGNPFLIQQMVHLLRPWG